MAIARTRGGELSLAIYRALPQAFSNAMERGEARVIDRDDRELGHAVEDDRGEVQAADREEADRVDPAWRVQTSPRMPPL